MPTESSERTEADVLVRHHADERLVPLRGRPLADRVEAQDPRPPARVPDGLGAVPAAELLEVDLAEDRLVDVVRPLAEQRPRELDVQDERLVLRAGRVCEGVQRGADARELRCCRLLQAVGDVPHAAGAARLVARHITRAVHVVVRGDPTVPAWRLAKEVWR